MVQISLRVVTSIDADEDMTIYDKGLVKTISVPQDRNKSSALF